MGTPVEITNFVEACGQIQGVNSAKLGFERNLSPAQYPMVRVIPGRITPGQPYGHRQVETSIYFAANLANSQGLESVYDCTFDIEQALVDLIQASGGTYIETLTDEDRIETYKLMFIRCNLTIKKPDA